MAISRRDPVQYGVLIYLIDDALGKLKRKQHSLAENGLGTTDADRLLVALSTIRQEVRFLKDWDISAFHALFLRLRNVYAAVGAVLTADHWQSPSCAASVVHQSGDEKRQIKANFNDYKRDQHAIGTAWEAAYADAYLKRGFRKAPVAFATSSGMAALTVSALLVRQRLPPKSRIAIGERSYFENKELLEMMFGNDAVRYFDEREPEELLTYMPHAVFVDSVANDPSANALDLTVLAGVLRNTGKPADMVVDFSCSAVSGYTIPRLLAGAMFVGFESLNKFHQFGMDRTTGGVVWASGISWDTVYKTRDHAGVNIAEYSASVLPMPDTSVLSLYLSRIRENADIVASGLSEMLSQRFAVSYPSGKRNKNNQGPFVSVSESSGDRKVYGKLVREVLRYADRSGIPLVAGTSFGMPVTRIYTWSPRSRFEKPFFRISPGLETESEIRNVLQSLTEAFRSV